MGILRQPRGLTFDEYLLVERPASLKSEYLDGFIYDMAGGSGIHAIIAANLLMMLGNALRGSGCRPVGSDLMVTNGARSFSAYPDVTVFCGPPVYLDGGGDVLLNPRVVIEVLSPRTERYDRGEKFARYKTIDTLDSIVLVSQDRATVLAWQRSGAQSKAVPGAWDAAPDKADGLEAMLTLQPLGVTMTLADIYEDVTFAV